MNRELGELQQEQRRRMFISSEGFDRGVAEFAGATALTEFILKPGLIVAAAVGAIATAGVEYMRSKRQPGNS